MSVAQLEEASKRLHAMEEGLASVCYYFEMQVYTDKGVTQNLLGREITSADRGNRPGRASARARLHEEAPTAGQLPKGWKWTSSLTATSTPSRTPSKPRYSAMQRRHTKRLDEAAEPIWKETRNETD